MAAPTLSQFIALRNLSRGSRQLRRPAAYGRCLAAGIQRDGFSMQQCEAARPIRHFSNSRQCRARGDDSTIDFAYLPETRDPEEPELYRVPILPDNYQSTTNAPVDEHAEVMKPEINTASADAIFLPMADLSDGHAMNIDFHAMADRVAVNLRQMKVPVEEQASMMKQIWADMVDDMLGLRKKDGGSK